MLADMLSAAGLERTDLEQEVLFELFRALSHYDERRASLPTFVERVIAAKTISVIRRERAQKRRKSANELRMFTEAPLKIEVRVEIHRALVPLSKFDQRIARLLLADYRPAEISRVLGVSRTAVYRGMDRIRDALRERGF